MNRVAKTVADLSVSAGAVLHVQQLDLIDARVELPVVQNLSFSLYPGRITGLVGESGSGKSLTARALMGLLPATIRQRGSIVLAGADTGQWSAKQWRQRRGRDVAMIFQDPLQALNPLRRVGSQMAEIWRRLYAAPHHWLVPRVRRDCREQLRQALLRVHLEPPDWVLQAYPHQLSGGMRQRVMIAMALLGRPKLLLADEPTAALDGHSRGGVLRELQQACQLNHCAVLLISHDLSVVEHCCDELLMLYGGTLVEQGTGSAVLNDPAHPYTEALIGARPRLSYGEEPELRAGQLPTIRGQLQAQHRQLKGCVFTPRCPKAQDKCSQQRPELCRYVGVNGPIDESQPLHQVACHYPRPAQLNPLAGRT